jgi:hypothetical protein
MDTKTHQIIHQIVTWRYAAEYLAYLTLAFLGCNLLFAEGMRKIGHLVNPLAWFADNIKLVILTIVLYSSLMNFQ